MRDIPGHLEGMETERRWRTPRTVNRGKEHGVCAQWPPASPCPGPRQGVQHPFRDSFFFKEMTNIARTTKKTCSKARTGPVCLQRPFSTQLRMCTVLFGFIKQAEPLLPRMLFWEKSQAESNKAEYFHTTVSNELIELVSTVM